MTLSPAPRDVPSLLEALVASDPGRPRLTWYGADGERVELSARVLDNWVAKTANLLVEELDAGPGTRVRLDLPPHWRTAVWLLAAWAVGADVVDEPAVDVVVATDAATDAGDARLVLVALPALARGVPHLPNGALDYNAEVSGFGDVLLADEPAVLPAVGPAPARARVLVTSSAWSTPAWLAPLLADGSVVLVDERLDEQRVARITEDERATTQL